MHRDGNTPIHTFTYISHIRMQTYRHMCMDINVYTQLRLGNRSGTLVHIQLYKVRL